MKLTWLLFYITFYMYLFMKENVGNMNFYIEIS